jgi:hypothetical protein
MRVPIIFLCFFVFTVLSQDSDIKQDSIGDIIQTLDVVRNSLIKPLGTKEGPKCIERVRKGVWTDETGAVKCPDLNTLQKGALCCVWGQIGLGIVKAFKGVALVSQLMYGISLLGVRTGACGVANATSAVAVSFNLLTNVLTNFTQTRFNHTCRNVDKLVKLNGVAK